MASYSTVVSIFAFLFFLWAFQLFAPRSMFAQELVNMPAHELIELVKDPQSDNRIQAIRELARRPMSLDSICLLYTSPSPRDQRGSRMPSSA